MFDETEDTRTYVVVVNDEAQYSLWPTGRAVPLGWKELATRGSKQDCLAYIREVWTDMRPLSLRRSMDLQNVVRPTRTERAVAAPVSRKAPNSPLAKVTPSQSRKARTSDTRKSAAAGSRKVPASASRKLSASASRPTAAKKAKRR